MRLRHIFPAACLTIIFFAYTLLAVFPSGAIELPFMTQLKPDLQTLVPQGWGFFTGNPRDERLDPYRISGEKAIPLSQWSPEGNLLGISRKGRSQGIEVGLLASNASPSDWHECLSEDVQECASTAPVGEIQVTNPDRSPSLCGSIVLVKSVPISWAYRDLTDLRSEAKSAVRLSVKCEHP